MTRRFALLAIFIALLVIAAGYVSAFLPGGAPRVASFAFAVATAAVVTAVSVLGAARREGLGGMRWVFAFTFLVMAGGFWLALLAPSPSSERLWLGLPGGAAIILYVVGLVPMVILPLAYALTFGRNTMSDAELDELRRRLEALRRAESQ